jgi:NitT/TauT family transport system substrate-binding protein
MPCRERHDRLAHRLFLIALAAVIAVSLLLYGGCGGGSGTRVVRAGFVQGDIHQLAYYVAREKGFFQDEGIDVREGGAFNSGAELMGAFSAGGLDVGYVAVDSAVTFEAQGMADIKIVAGVNEGGSALVERSGLGGKDAAALKGHTVAVPGFSSIQNMLLGMAFRRAGLNETDESVISLQTQDMITALQEFRIDAFLAPETYPSLAAGENAGSVLLTSERIWPGHPCCVLVADSAFLRRNPDTVRRLVAAHVKATDYIKKNPAEAIDMARIFTGQKRGVVEGAMKNIDFTCGLDVKKLGRYVLFMEEQGVVEKGQAGRLTEEIVDKRLIPMKGE